MNTDMETTVIIEPGTGYWDCTKYPWGGSFKRTAKTGGPIKGKLRAICSTFSDGSPKQILVTLPHCENAGFVVGLRSVRICIKGE